MIREELLAALEAMPEGSVVHMATETIALGPVGKVEQHGEKQFLLVSEWDV